MSAIHSTLTAAATVTLSAAIVAERNNRGKTAAIIVSAGNSARMGGKVSKQFLNIGGIPVLERTLRTFFTSPMIGEIVVVARKSDFPIIHDIRARLGITIPFSLAEGGKTRALSVQAGLEKVSKNAKYIAIHDGARCLVTEEDIEKVCRAAFRYKAATAAHRGTDSLKIANSRGFIDRSLDRDTVWMVQTPQVFDVNLYRAALATAKDTVNVTDDNALMEQIQYPVKLVECDKNNIKITRPEDLARAEEILKEREEKL